MISGIEYFRDIVFESSRNSSKQFPVCSSFCTHKTDVLAVIDQCGSLHNTLPKKVGMIIPLHSIFVDFIL